jgi:hypothetical protein
VSSVVGGVWFRKEQQLAKEKRKLTPFSDIEQVQSEKKPFTLR